jgi:prevent-host-death family protein
VERLTIKKARNEFGNIINFVCFGNKSYQVTRYGKPVAIIISIEQWNEIQKVMSRVKVVD